MTIYLLFYGLRGFVFTDTENYYCIYNDIGAGRVENYFEPAFILSCSVCNQIGFDYFTFQFFWTLIDVVLLMKVLQNEAKDFQLLAFALLIPFFDGVQMNLMRNIKSILLFFLGLNYIRSRQLFKYCLCTLLGLAFHATAILFFPIYFFINYRNRIVYCSASLLALYASVKGFGFIQSAMFSLALLSGNKIEHITEVYSESGDAGLTLGYAYRIFILMILLAKYKTLAAKNTLCLHLSILYLILSLLFNSAVILRDRLSVLFILAFISIIPYIPASFKNKRVRTLFVMINMVCTVGFVYNPHKLQIAEYQNIVFDHPVINKK